MSPSSMWLFVFVICTCYLQCMGTKRDKQHRLQARNRYQELVLYPRVGKRIPVRYARAHNINRRRQFLNFLATSLQRTGGLRGVIHEIQDMSESKRSASSTKDQWNNFLNSFVINRYDQMELDRSARMMQKWSKARIGKRSYATSIPIYGFVEGTDDAMMMPRLYASYIRVPIRWNRMPGMT